MIKIKYKKVDNAHLFIDRLVVKLNFLPGEAAHQTHNALFQIFDDPECFSGTQPANTVQIEKKIVLASVTNSKHHAHLIYRYADHQAQWMRMTLHPRDMGLQGFEDLHNVLGLFLEEGWGSFVAGAKVTQIEVSIDLEGVPFNNVHVLPDQVQTSTLYKSGQQIETIYLGKSKSNQTIVYDRGGKRKKKKQYDKAGPCTRIERKKSNLNLYVHELGKLTNPFSHVKFVDVPAIPPPDEVKEYLWTLFTDAVAQRGLDPALKLLPQAKRTAYRNYISAQQQPWWKPGIIWYSWPKVLEDLKLTNPKFWG
jgi:hypothetical protein